MGTTLTGTTPQDTYDSLIKVTDNGPLSGTAKYLSDGLGNDSALALSTSAVGIGTSSPAGNLHIASAADTGIRIQGGASSLSYIDLADTASGTPAGSIAYNHITNAIVFNGGGTNTEFARITSAGNVGIGTSAPSRVLTLKNNAGATNGISFQSLASTSEIAAIECNQTLDTIDFEMATNFAGNGFRFLTGTPLVERARFTANGLTFNGDTAAANALDDYEEGTWTMGISFGGGSTGITYSNNTGTYTKIGRQVTVNGYISLTSKGSSTGNALLTGLPFTIGNSIPNFSVPSLWFNNVSFTNQFQGYANYGTTTVLLQEITTLGSNSSLTDADFANNSEIMVSLTYFV